MGEEDIVCMYSNGNGSKRKMWLPGSDGFPVVEGNMTARKQSFLVAVAVPEID
jgi:hypothetical protein